MIPGVSAGSNQVGASDTCTAHVSWPSGPAAIAVRWPMAAMPSADSAIIPRRVISAGALPPVRVLSCFSNKPLRVFLAIVASR